MCLIDACEEMQRLAVAMELERVRPDMICKQCRTDDPCAFHRSYFDQDPRAPTTV